MKEKEQQRNLKPEELRHAAHEHSDWIANYFEQVREYPVLSQAKPGELVDRLPGSGPETGEPIEKIFEDFQSLIFPSLTLWNHPRFHAYYPASASGPGILAEMLAGAVNVNVMLWKSSPAATELEQVTLSWLRQWLGLPDEFFGIIYDTASVSTLHAIAAARELIDPESRLKGTRPGLILYLSEQTHSSAEKAAIMLGLGQENVRKIPVDDQFRMKPDELSKAIEADLTAGKTPFCVVATVGTTSTASIDPVPEIAEIAERYGLWLHVDGAYAASAAIAPEMQYILDGVSRAHSFMMNPHKWLFAPVDVSVLYTRYPEILRRAFSLVPEYLRTTEDPRAVNFMDYGIQLGRRFRALKLWYIFRYYGREGIAGLLREHIRLAQLVEQWVAEDSDFELAAPRSLSLVCFRYHGSDEENQELMARLNASGQAFLSHTVLHGRFVIRLSIGNVQTTEQDVRAVWETIQMIAREIKSASACPVTR